MPRPERASALLLYVVSGQSREGQPSAIQRSTATCLSLSFFSCAGMGISEPHVECSVRSTRGFLCSRLVPHPASRVGMSRRPLLSERTDADAAIFTIFEEVS